jgi:hypothetical protein
MSKSKTEMLFEAITVGRDKAEQLGYSKDYKNWSSLSLWCYVVGVTGGFIGGTLATLLSLFIYLIIIQY